VLVTECRDCEGIAEGRGKLYNLSIRPRVVLREMELDKLQTVNNGAGSGRVGKRREVRESASNSDDFRSPRHGRAPTRLLPAPTAFYQPRRFSDLAENPQGHIVR
jgi:hypothetical protein